MSPRPHLALAPAIVLRRGALLLLLAWPFPSVAASPPPRGVHEEGFVRIGGIPQWITIHGRDDRNPAILFLHGGPGDALSPVAASLFVGWDADFTLVQWDQRGAGRTYAKNGPGIEPTMTMERMVEDGIEVAEHVRRRLGARRVVLVGSSWGSVLGVQMVLHRPDLFGAYVGLAQVVDVRRAHATGYARVLDLARTAGDSTTVTALTGLGPPPWDSLKKWLVFHRALLRYQAREASAPPAPAVVDSAYASPAERASNAEADDFSFVHFEGLTMAGPFEQVRLAARGTRFQVPVYVVQGERDLVAPAELTRVWFDAIEAPRKRFVMVPDTGHEPSAAQLALTLELLRTDVRPRCTSGTGRGRARAR